jgi:hypothetical protein
MKDLNEYQVVYKHPFYPEVLYCSSLEEAEKEFEQFTNEAKRNFGHSEGIVTISQIIKKEEFTVNY